MDEYNVYCEFNIDKHKETYTHYLEVILFPDGHIEYAVPSHQEKLIEVACSQLGVSRRELFDMCPDEYSFDVITWLCNITKCVSVWTEGIMWSDKYHLTKEQCRTMKELKEKGIYEGTFYDYWKGEVV